MTATDPYQPVIFRDPKMDSTELEIGEYYYLLTYADKDWTVPGLQPVIYVGTNVLEEDFGSGNETYYFQDSVSFGRFGLATKAIASDAARCALLTESPKTLK